jgi:hypothetical protein
MAGNDQGASAATVEQKKARRFNMPIPFPAGAKHHRMQLLASARGTPISKIKP